VRVCAFVFVFVISGLVTNIYGMSLVYVNVVYVYVCVFVCVCVCACRFDHLYTFRVPYICYGVHV